MKKISDEKHIWTKRVSCLAAAFLAMAALSGCDSVDSETAESAGKGAAAGAVIGGVVGNQSDETAEGAGLGAAAGAAIGAAIEEYGDDDGETAADDYDIEDPAVDYGELMTEAEKERVMARSGESNIDDWGDYLTDEEKQRLLRRGDA